MMKDKVKDLMKKVTSSSSPSPFKGQGHVLGSSSSSSSAPTSKPPPNPTPTPKPQPQFPIQNSNPDSSFSPYSPLTSTTTTTTTSSSLSCPVCSTQFASESDVSNHLDSCLLTNSTNSIPSRVADYLSSDPPDSAVEVVKKLLANLSRDPANDKFRKIRLANPRIKEAVVDVKGGVELFEAVGFRVGKEGEEAELFATMVVVPEEETVGVIRQAVLMLERMRPVAKEEEEKKDVVPVKEMQDVGVSCSEVKKIDREVRVFFSVPESAAAKIDLPDSYYNLTSEEMKREARMRKERLEQSRLLIPKSYKEKQALAARQKYKRTVIRIQFPDGVILQGVFLPWETTPVLYEFVTSALKEPSLEFELLRPAAPKLRLIPCFAKPGERTPTLEVEDLVPSALLKFKPKETDSTPFTGLIDELLQIIEPLTSSVQQQ